MDGKTDKIAGYIDRSLERKSDGEIETIFSLATGNLSVPGSRTS